MECNRSQFTYTYCYCEENVWLLGKELVKRGHSTSDLYAIIISNDNKTVPFYRADGSSVVWDYHVFLFSKSVSSVIYDFDANGLPFPTPLNDYVEKVLCPEKKFYERYQRIFRVVPVNEYWDKFSSDRSHMVYYSHDGKPVYASPPPDYPTLQLPGIVTNLFSHFVNMNNKEIGNVCSEQEFLNFVKQT